MGTENDPYLYEKFKDSFREHSDRYDPEPTEYDWLHGLGKLWRDAIDSADKLPKYLRDPREVLKRGSMLNELLEQRKESNRLLRYILEYSHVRELLSDAYIEDVERVLAEAGAPVPGDTK